MGACKPHLCKWLRFTCLLVGLDALQYVEFAFSQVLALLNCPNPRLFLSVLLLGAALQPLCLCNWDRLHTGKGLRKSGQSSTETWALGSSFTAEQCCETDSLMYSLLPVCLGSSAATEFFQTSTNTPSWFHCSCLWRTELERIYCDNKNLDRCVRLFSLIFDLNLFSFSLLLSLSTPYGEKFISCLFSSSFNISESLY